MSEIPEAAVDLQSRYAVFLGLAQSEINGECLMDAYLALEYFAGVSILNDVLNNKRKKRFFMHLLVHHAAVIPRNMFGFTFNNIECGEIFDVLSLFNHSCMPQLVFKNKRKNGNISELVTCRAIKQGEQVFIDYLGGEMANEDEARKTCLKTSWGFDCKCCLCTR